MEETDNYDSYRATHANHTNTKIRSIVSRSNQQYDSLAGTSFSNTKLPMTTIIQDREFLVYDNIKLTGKFKLITNGTAIANNITFNGSAFSLIDSLQIIVGGQVDVNLTQYFQYIVHLLAKLKLNYTEYKQFELTTLAGVSLVNGDELDFELPIGSVLGLAKKFLPTADLMKIEIKIQFQKNLPEVFNVAESEDDGVITGYALEEVHITGDNILYDANISERILNTFRSAQGVQIPSHSYGASTQNFLQGSLTHHFTPTATYTNLVNTWCLPVPQSITPNAVGVSETDYVSVSKYNGGGYPQDFILRLGNGGSPVNQNGIVGCSNKMSFYNGVLKTVASNENRDNVGWKLTEQYNANSYQIVSGSWLKSMSNSPSILNSGINTYLNSGQLSIRFKTAEEQNTKALLFVNEFTSVLKIAQGQVALME